MTQTQTSTPSGPYEVHATPTTEFGFGFKSGWKAAHEGRTSREDRPDAQVSFLSGWEDGVEAYSHYRWVLGRDAYEAEKARS